MTSQRLSLDVGPVDGVVNGRVDPVKRYEEVERPQLSTKHAAHVVADAVEVRYLSAVTTHTRYTVNQSINQSINQSSSSVYDICSALA